MTTTDNSLTDYKKLFENTEGQVDTEKEYKEFEKRLKKDNNKDALVKAIDEGKGSDIVDLFGKDMLSKKVEEAKSGKMKDDVREAYLVLGELMNKGTFAAGYNELLDNAESNIREKKALEQAFKKVNKLIDKQKGRTKLEKEAASNSINSLFNDCESLEEFERRSKTRLNTIEAMDNASDLIRGIPALQEEIYKAIGAAGIEFLNKCGVAKDRLISLCKDAIESGKMEINEFVEWCEKQGQTISDIANTILSWGGIQFKKFLNYLEGAKRGVQEALNTAWEYCGKQWDKFIDTCGDVSDTIINFGIALAKKGELAWNSLLASINASKEKIQEVLEAAWEACGKQWDKFVNICGGMSDAIIDFGYTLVEMGELTRKEFVGSLKNNWDKAKDLCAHLLEEGKIKIGEVADWCREMGRQGHEFLIGLIEDGKLAWNSVADWCKNHWEIAKDMFKNVVSKLLQKGKLALNSFVDRCKGAWETVKQTACKILVELVNAGKFTLDVVANALLIAVGTIALVCDLLIDAGKQIYEGSKKFIKFIGDVVAMARKNGVNIVKSLVAKCKAFGLKVVDLAKGLRDSLKNVGMNAVTFIKEMAESIKIAFSNKWRDIVNFFQNLGMTMKDILSTLCEYGIKQWEGFKGFVLDAFKSFREAIDFLKNKLNMTINAIGEFIVGCKKRLLDFLNYVKNLGLITYQNVMAWCKNSWIKAKDIFKTLINSAKATFSEIYSWLGDSLSKLKDVIVSAFGTAVEGLKKCILWLKKGTIEGAKFLLKLGLSITGAFFYAMYKLGTKFIDIAKTFGNWLKECGKNVFQAAKDIVNAACEYFKNVASEVCEALFSIWSDAVNVGKAVCEALKGAANAVKDWIYNKTKDVKKAINAMKKWLSNSIKDVYKWMKDKGVSVVTACKAILEVFADTFTDVVKTLYQAGVSVTDLVAAGGRRILSILGIG